jgi:hypothetical protein
VVTVSLTTGRLCNLNSSSCTKAVSFPCENRGHTNSRCNLPDVLPIGPITKLHLYVNRWLTGKSYSTMNEKNARTALENTADDIQQARDDNGCDDAEEEDENEDEEHGEGPVMLHQECKTRWSSTHAMGGMLQQECKTRWSSTHATGDSLMTMSQFPRLSRMTRQYLTVSASSVSPERLFNSVGLVKSDLRGRLLDTTLIDVTWAK